MKNFYDVIGIGFGPANIALAIGLEELAPELDVRFLESQDSASWHPDMLLSGSDIQNNPLRDLVTPRNPKSHYTFVNFLKENGRLFDHLNLGITFPLRAEYYQYIKWVASFFESQVAYSKKVIKVNPIFELGGQEGYCVETSDGEKYYGRSVVFAPGRTPYVPDVLAGLNSDRVIHFNRLLSSLASIDERELRDIAIIGSSQSAVEITIELRKRFPFAKVTNVLRNFGFRQKDLSPFTGEVFYPEFSEYYFSCDKKSKESLDKDLRYTNYSSADSDVLDQLYLELYADKIGGISRSTILNNQEIQAASKVGDKVNLVLKERYTNAISSRNFDLVVAATGFRDLGPLNSQELCPPLLQQLLPYLDTDDSGCIRVGRDYEVIANSKILESCPIILNGLCEKTHGMGDAGSFSLLSLRAQQIVAHLANGLVAGKKINNTSIIKNAVGA